MTSFKPITFSTSSKSFVPEKKETCAFCPSSININCTVWVNKFTRICTSCDSHRKNLLKYEDTDFPANDEFLPDIAIEITYNSTDVTHYGRCSTPDGCRERSDGENVIHIYPVSSRFTKDDFNYQNELINDTSAIKFYKHDGVWCCGKDLRFLSARVIKKPFNLVADAIRKRDFKKQRDNKKC